jgi:hypothetical protein
MLSKSEKMQADAAHPFHTVLGDCCCRYFPTSDESGFSHRRTAYRTILEPFGHLRGFFSAPAALIASNSVAVKSCENRPPLSPCLLKAVTISSVTNRSRSPFLEPPRSKVGEKNNPFSLGTSVENQKSQHCNSEAGNNQTPPSPENGHEIHINSFKRFGHDAVCVAPNAIQTASYPGSSGY